MDFHLIDPATADAIRSWIAPGAVTLVCFFLGRYIVKRDKFETDTEKKFSAQQKRMDEKLQAHADRILAASNDFSQAVLAVKNEAADMRKVNLDFQLLIQEKLAAFEAQTNTIKTTLERTAEKAGEVESKIDICRGLVDQVVEKVQFHDSAIGDLSRRTMENKFKIEKTNKMIVGLKGQKARKG